MPTWRRTGRRSSAGRSRRSCSRDAASVRKGLTAALYGELARHTGSPVVELNRAIALAEAQGAEAGLAILDGLPLEDFHYLHSSRGELLRRLGRNAEAAAAYRGALRLVGDDAERRLLERRLAELSG